jgi:Flp pilus assembly protein TadB
MAGQGQQPIRAEEDPRRGSCTASRRRKRVAKIQAAATDKQTKLIEQSYKDLIKGNAADTVSLNQQAEQGIKQNINAATIELGNYQNLALRVGLILFGIVLVAFAVWRFVAQPGMRVQASAASACPSRCPPLPEPAPGPLAAPPCRPRE